MDGLIAKAAGPKVATNLQSKRGTRQAKGPSDRSHKRQHEHRTVCCHQCGRSPIRFFMSAGQVSGYIGAAALLGRLLKAEWLLPDRGYDADWFREALKGRGIKPCIPGLKSCGKPVKYGRCRNRIKIMFG